MEWSYYLLNYDSVFTIIKLFIKYFFFISKYGSSDVSVTTSALEVYTEREALRDIMDMDYARICIVTTHRPSVLSMCDRVYRIDKGRVGDIGHGEVEQLIKNF